ncbi:hypothetical protein P1X15_24810 [Runella sp. MFBS21]|uniref:DUF6915 family protein n=1 Tax=Runella sp. MFBS21 TaxID=3034018 RepID=UPI0023FA272D|nr:hypothetical protein [Runella sp. MFBS21]MDF7820867.1 hypothetical protein [Runella sp. MFBS21]
MNVWKHCLLSTKKFGGLPEDYFSIHDFIDSSKLFIFHAKHRAMLHNLYGIELCISLFGHYIVNTDNKTILVRDIAAEHCKEDLSGFIPTLNDWFIDFELPNDFIIPNIEDSQLKEFLFKPLLRSSCKSSMIITCSNFGVYLVEKIYGLEKALLLAQYISPQQTINHLLKDFRLIHKWQIFPSKIDLIWLQEQENERN